VDHKNGNIRVVRGVFKERRDKGAMKKVRVSTTKERKAHENN
jgi:hypothetical protein